jgi:hypothetical protein
LATGQGQALAEQRGHATGAGRLAEVTHGRRQGTVQPRSHAVHRVGILVMQSFGQGSELHFYRLQWAFKVHRFFHRLQLKVRMNHRQGAFS